MKYELERKIILSTDSEYKNLYTWSLQEYSEKDEKVGAPQIPWNWGVQFIAKDLCYNRTIEIVENSYSNLSFGNGDHSDTEKKVGEDNITEVLDNERISGTLLTTQFRWGGWQHDFCSLSMFGTKRTIKEIRLDICISQTEGKEYCDLWGCPSYTNEVDFEDITEEDVLYVNLSISPNRFKQIVELIKNKQINSCMVSLSNVSGFYSEWSPSVRANKIKVLCDGSAHAVEFPEGLDIDLPRLGSVQKFSLNLISESNLDVKNDFGLDEEIEDDVSLEATDHTLDREGNKAAIGNMDDGRFAKLANNQTVLSRIVKLLWAIIFLLGLIFLNLAT